MSERQGPANFEYPTTDATPRQHRQLAESMVTFDLHSAITDDAGMSRQIDEIHDQLARDIPGLQRGLDALLNRARRPGLG
jgi:hypothetical protein